MSAASFLDQTLTVREALALLLLSAILTFLLVVLVVLVWRIWGEEQ